MITALPRGVAPSLPDSSPSWPSPRGRRHPCCSRRGVQTPGSQLVARTDPCRGRVSKPPWLFKRMTEVIHAKQRKISLLFQCFQRSFSSSSLYYFILFYKDAGQQCTGPGRMALHHGLLEKHDTHLLIAGALNGFSKLSCPSRPTAPNPAGTVHPHPSTMFHRHRTTSLRALTLLLDVSFCAEMRCSGLRRATGSQNVFP